MSEHTFTGPPIWTYSSGTMDLRDWFAGMCRPNVEMVHALDDVELVFLVREMCGRDAADQFVDQQDGQEARIVYRCHLEAKAIAALRYMQADAMMAERERGKEDE